MNGFVIGIGFAASIFFLMAFNEIASAIKSVAKAMDERNKIEQKKMELQGLELKSKDISSDEVNKIVRHSY